jgi:hypothetical protein
MKHYLPLTPNHPIHPKLPLNPNLNLIWKESLSMKWKRSLEVEKLEEAHITSSNGEVILNLRTHRNQKRTSPKPPTFSMISRSFQDENPRESVIL